MVFLSTVVWDPKGVGTLLYTNDTAGKGHLFRGISLNKGLVFIDCPKIRACIFQIFPNKSECLKKKT